MKCEVRATIPIITYKITAQSCVGTWKLGPYPSRQNPQVNLVSIKRCVHCKQEWFHVYFAIKRQKFSSFSFIPTVSFCEIPFNVLIFTIFLQYRVVNTVFMYVPTAVNLPTPELGVIIQK